MVSVPMPSCGSCLWKISVSGNFQKNATAVAYLQWPGIEYLDSFDDDFDRVEGITRLETPDNLFN